MEIRDVRYMNLVQLHKYISQLNAEIQNAMEEVTARENGIGPLPGTASPYKSHAEAGRGGVPR